MVIFCLLVYRQEAQCALVAALASDSGVHLLCILEIVPPFGNKYLQPFKAQSCKDEKHKIPLRHCE
jgi:hypothetical protein